VGFEPLPCWAPVKLSKSTNDARREGKGDMLVMIFPTESRKEATRSSGYKNWNGTRRWEDEQSEVQTYCLLLIQGIDTYAQVRFESESGSGSGSGCMFSDPSTAGPLGSWIVEVPRANRSHYKLWKASRPNIVPWSRDSASRRNTSYDGGQSYRKHHPTEALDVVSWRQRSNPIYSLLPTLPAPWLTHREIRDFEDCVYGS